MYDHGMENPAGVMIENSADDAKLKDIIENVERLTAEYKLKNSIEDIADLTQLQYNGFLMYISFNYFKPTKILYKHYPGISNDKKITLLYNDHLVNILSDYYIYLCSNYNKIPNIYGFSLFSGIHYDTIDKWAGVNDQRPDASDTAKKLLKAYENALENGAQTGKNAVGYIATLNHRFKWSADSKPQLTVNITRTRDEILQTINPALLSEISGTP